MARSTDRWGLSILGPGDAIADDGFKFSAADRILMDRILAYAAENHRHTGTTSDDLTPVAGLTLSLQNTGGAMPAGARYYYRYTVIDEGGNESAGSPVQSIDTPGAVAAPQAPSPTPVTGTGDLGPGTYSYVFSAYVGTDTLETKALNSAAIKIPGTDPHNSVSVILPDLPSGATGLNAYRKSPSGMHYLWITAIDASTSGQIWIDDGAIEGDCDRSLPATNRTSNDNMVTVVYPGATPSVPAGWSWRIYRSSNPNDWGRSYLAEITPQGTPPVTPTAYPDVGGATQIGGPPAKSQVITSPPKINMTNGAEVTGSPPPGLLVTPQEITFHYVGPVDVSADTWTWVCDYDEADIISVRAYLGVDSTPAAADVIVDVNALRPSAGSSTWDSIFTDPADQPRVLVDENVGDAVEPTAIIHLERGDALSPDVDQAGGGATPTDYDLAINVLMYVKAGSETQSYPWPTP